jgi:hypothetical protein
MLWQVEQPDFRCTHPYPATDANGRTVMLRLCEELVDGRWEPFISTCRDFKAEAAYPN